MNIYVFKDLNDKEKGIVIFQENLNLLKQAEKKHFRKVIKRIYTWNYTAFLYSGKLTNIRNKKLPDKGLAMKEWTINATIVRSYKFLIFYIGKLNLLIFLFVF